MVTRMVRKQLVIFSVLTLITALVLGLYYLSLPSAMGVGRYTLQADLPASGGLYRTANVTYRGVTIGKVTAVEPTKSGVRATLSIDDSVKIPVDSTANVHSVSAVGEQYLDLVSEGNPGQFLAAGQTITKGTVPEDIGTALSAVDRGLAALPKAKIGALLDETAKAVGGLGPALNGLVDSVQSLSGELNANTRDINDVIEKSVPLLNSQANSGEDIKQWIHNLSVVAAQTSKTDPQLKSVLANAAPTLGTASEVVDGVGESLPQTLANLQVVTGLLARYRKGVEQVLVMLPQVGSIAQTVTMPFDNEVNIDLALAVNQSQPCLTGFVPPEQWRSPADTRMVPLPSGTYCRIPQQTPNVNVRGARNIPCIDVDGKRAAYPRECRGEEPYSPMGTNPWYGDPNQIVNCPAPGARCDQPVKPGAVIPAPSVNNGLNPLQSDLLPEWPVSTTDPLIPPGSGTVQCNGQQPNPCSYTPSVAGFAGQASEVTGPGGVRYSVSTSTDTGEDGWKKMLAPVS